MKNLYVSLVTFFASAAAFGQYSDSLVIAEGRIVNAATKQPVEARIQYQSLPYGNRIGILNNSIYSFPMFDNERYAIIVEADGYLPAKYMLDPAAANDSGKVVMNIELTAGNHSTHTPGQVLRLNNLIFQMSKSKISPESYGELEVVLKMMKDNNKMIIQLEGHTDYLGNPRDNMKLSKDRVDAVKKFLTSRGIPSSRIKTKAFGGTMPISRDETPEGHSLNRRVELRILSN
jgi:OmpA-OmpF porin, OOP family